MILRDLRIGDATATVRFWRDADGRSHAEALESRGTFRLLQQPPIESLSAGIVDRLRALVDSMRR